MSREPSDVEIGLVVNVVSGSGFPDAFQGLTGEELPFYKVSSLKSADLGKLGTADNSISTATAAKLKARIIPPGSVVMAKIGAALFLGRYAQTTVPCCIDNNMQALVPRTGMIDSRYLSYVMTQVPLRALVKDGPVPTVDVMGLKMTHVPYQAFENQQAIADSLDRETGEIDAMIGKMDELKEELTSRRWSVIQSETVDRDATLTRLKFCASVTLGKVVQNSKKSEQELFVNYVRAASIQPHGLKLDDQRMWMNRDEISRLNLLRDDVLIVEGGGGYGRSVVLNEDMPGWGFQNHVIRVRPEVHYDGRFINYCVKGHFAAGLIDILVEGATIPALSSEKARELPIPQVDLEEQRLIADQLDEATGHIDGMLAKVDELKALLIERRAALITDVVTGRKKVA